MLKSLYGLWLYLDPVSRRWVVITLAGLAVAAVVGASVLVRHYLPR